MENDETMAPLDEAFDADLAFNSPAARDWFDSVDADLEEYGLFEDSHGYSITDAP